MRPVAELVKSIAREEVSIDVDIEVVENPRAGEETIVEQFHVDTSAVADELGWQAEHSLASSVRSLLQTAFSE